MKKNETETNDSNNRLRALCEKKLMEKYPNVSEKVRKKLNFELDAIKKTDSAKRYLQAAKIVDEMELKPYEMAAFGPCASSMVGYLLGCNNVDPIEADLPPVFLYGFNGDRLPDIDFMAKGSMECLLLKLYESTGVNPMTISIDDPNTENMLFSSSVGIDPVLQCFNYRGFLQMLSGDKPEGFREALKKIPLKGFTDLVKLFSLTQSATPWFEYAVSEIEKGTVTISDVITSILCLFVSRI